jgi:hypothetical protein
MIDILDCETELVFVPFGIGTILAVAVSTRSLIWWPSKSGFARSFNRPTAVIGVLSS